jgi:Ca2+-binding RTX toxin-like protein
MTVINGGNGSDTLTGGADDDTISGGNGSDTVAGGEGDDTIDGGNGADTLEGGSGSDTITGGNGNDDIDGGEGADIINGEGGSDTIHNGATQDFVTDLVNGGSGNDTLIHDGGDAEFTGSEGNDTFFTVAAGDYFDLMRVSYRTSTSGIVANLTAAAGFAISDGLGGTDTVTGANQIRDSNFDDTFFFDAAYAATVNGRVQAHLGAGDDSVTFTGVSNATVNFNGAAGGVIADLAAGTATDVNATDDFIGNDTFTGVFDLFGTGHDDQLYGNDSNNAIRGSEGDDYIDGRGGLDELNYVDVVTGQATHGVTVDLSQNLVSDDGFGGTDQVYNMERVRGSMFDDTITGDNGDNRLRGEEGNDVLSGLGGDDLLIGDVGDTPAAAGGADTLDGGAGVDTLVGGVGDDKFVFFAGEAQDDVVQDFEGAGVAGGDLLEFHYGGNGTVTYAGGDLWTISGDNGTDTIQIAGVTTLDSSDYLFV